MYPTPVDLLNDSFRDCVRGDRRSLAAIARAVGTHRQTLSRWVHWSPSDLDDPDPPGHVRFLSASTLDRLAAILAVDVSVTTQPG